MKNTIRALFVLITSLFSPCFADNPAPKKSHIGLCIVATGRYDRFVEPLIKSARNHFLKDQKVTYFVFTDGTIPTAPDIVRIEQKRIGWPFDTLKRFEIYAKAKKYFNNVDYLFALDADMRFVGPVGSEILGYRVATLHPGYYNNKKRPYEKKRISTAYLNSSRGYYFCGGFWGAQKSEFITLCEKITANINIDLQKNYIAIWHDESHLNRYMHDNKPTLILSPSYCYPESLNLGFPRKIIALDKNHESMRK